RREPPPAVAQGQPGLTPAPARRHIGRAGVADGGVRSRLPRHDASADPLDAERHRIDLSVASPIAPLGSGIERADDPLLAVARAVQQAYGHHLVAIFELRGDRIAARAVASADPME